MAAKTYTRTMPVKQANAMAEICKAAGLKCHAEISNNKWTRARVVFWGVRPGSARSDKVHSLIESLFALGVGR